MLRCPAACLLLVTPALAQVVPYVQVLPPAAAATESPTSTALPFGAAAARRVQFAYDGSTLGHQHPMRITAIELRPEGGALGGAVAGTYNLTLHCSTSRNPVGALDPVFANNHGGDRTTVFSGAWNVPAPAVGQAPNPFGLRIPFSQPFAWDPRSGPLLLDFACQAATPAFGAWDAIAVGTGSISALGAAATTATASSNVAPVLRLTAAAQCVPAGSATVEGATAVTQGDLWGSASLNWRRQDLYEPAAFGFTTRQLITGIGWRADGGVATNAALLDATVSMSTAAVTAATMQWQSSANHGPDRRVVFDGTWLTPASPANPDPTRFDVFLPFDRPFDYDPARGPLLIDIRRRGAQPWVGSVSFDAVQNAGLGRSLVVDSSTGSGLAFTAPLPVICLRTVPIPTAPSSLANATNPQPSASNTPFNVAQGRAMNVVSAAAAGISQPVTIDHLRFRPSAGTTAFGPATFTARIDLSHAATTPTTLSSTFDGNHGSNRLRVFDGQFSVHYGTRAGNDPTFPIEVKLQRPFRWDPALAPYLAIDVVVTGLAGSGFTVETTAGLPIDDGRITASTATATSGFVADLAFVVQLGGTDQNGLATVYGSGCPGTNGYPRCTPLGVPTLPNRELRVGLRNAAGNAPALLTFGFAAATTPVLGAPGCEVLHGLELGSYGVVVTDTGGTGSLALPLPSALAFEGLTLRGQWLVLDGAANPLGVTTSDGLLLVARFL